MRQIRLYLSFNGLRYFTFGPSGSGANLRPENGLPFFDVLIHGSKRWLLLQEDEMERVAAKAREALEFDKTSAYMFFEEKGSFSKLGNGNGTSKGAGKATLKPSFSATGEAAGASGGVRLEEVR